MSTLSRRDPGLAASIAGYPWVLDGITDDERWALYSLNNLHAQDPSLGAAVAGLPWILEGITGDERWALYGLDNLHKQDASLGAAVASFPWTVDDITHPESRALLYLADLAEQDLSLGQAIADYPWVVDNITDPEMWSLSYLADLAEQDLSVGQAIAGFPWVLDDITDDEQWSLYYLNDLQEQDASLGLQLAAMPFLASSFQAHDRHALKSIFTLSESPTDFALLTKQGWFQDGLEDEEAAFVTVLADLAQRSPEEYRAMVDTHYAQSVTVQLPLGGELQLFGFRRLPFQQFDPALDVVAGAAQALENFMGIPFPDEEIILLFVDGVLNPDGDFVLGRNVGTHLLVTRPETIQGDFRDVLAHEVAHYYWGYENAPVWFAEGGADFLGHYALDSIGWRSLADWRSDLSSGGVATCAGRGAHTIQYVIDSSATYLASNLFICNYALGESLLQKLYQTIGPEGASTAWNQLYLLAETEGRPVTDFEIYQTFRRNTPNDRVAEFQGVYDRWHGGDFSE